MEYSCLFIIIFFSWNIGPGEGANDNNNMSKRKIDLPMRAMMTRLSQLLSQEVGLVMEAAVNHINDLEGILDDYHICFQWNDTKDTSQAVAVLYEYIYNGPPIPMMFGPPYSSISALLNPVVAEYNIIQVTTASSPAIGDRKRFPLTIQMYPIEDDMNPGRVSFIKLMKWKRVAIVFHDIEYFRGNTNDLIRRLSDADIGIVTVEAMSNPSNPDTHIRNLKRHDARIIILLAFETGVLSFMCKAYEYGLYGPKYATILPGWIIEDEAPWPGDAPCAKEDILPTLINVFYVNTIRIAEDIESINYNGVRASHEQKQYWSTMEFSNKISRNLDRIIYDAIFTMAMALNQSIKDLQLLNPPTFLENFTYGDEEMKKVFNFNVRHLEFTGISGFMRTNISNTRDPSGIQLFVSQYIDEQRITSLHFDQNGNNPTYVNDTITITWAGGFVPVDGKTLVPEFIVISQINRIIILTLTSIGVMLTLIFLFINIWYRRVRVVRMTSPTLNTFILFGSMLMYMSTIIFAVEYSDARIIFSRTLLCYIQYSLTTIGFTLAMGTIFMKTYRVNAIIQKALKGIRMKQKQDLQDSELIRRIFALVGIDIVVMTVWIILDPLQVHFEQLDGQLDLTQPGKEVYIVPVLPRCDSNHRTIFLVCLMISKALLLLFGVFLAWKTRNVKIDLLNDSKHITASVYLITIVVIIHVPALTVVTNDVNLQFALTGSALVFTISAVLCILFLPKIFMIWKSDGEIRRATDAVKTESVSTSKDAANTSNQGNYLVELLEKQQQLAELTLRLGNK